MHSKYSSKWCIGQQFQVAHILGSVYSLSLSENRTLVLKRWSNFHMYHGTNFLSPVVTRLVICIIFQTPQILNPSFFNSSISTRSMFSIRPNKQFHGIQFSETCHIKVMNNRLFCSLNYQNMSNFVNLVTNLNQLGQWA